MNIPECLFTADAELLEWRRHRRGRTFAGALRLRFAGRDIIELYAHEGPMAVAESLKLPRWIRLGVDVPDELLATLRYPIRAIYRSGVVYLAPMG
jgi:hypothetical protein